MCIPYLYCNFFSRHFAPPASASHLLPFYFYKYAVKCPYQNPPSKKEALPPLEMIQQSDHPSHHHHPFQPNASKIHISLVKKHIIKKQKAEYDT